MASQAYPAVETRRFSLRVRGEVGGAGTTFLLFLFAAIAAFALYTIWAFWPSEAASGARVARSKTVEFFGVSRVVSRETLFFVTVAVSGVLGGMVHVLRSLGWYVGNGMLKWRWVPFYLLRPVLGCAMATLLYFVVRAGFFSPSASTTEASPYGFAALAALAGLFSDHAAEKLKKVASEIFEEPPQGKDSAVAQPEVEIGAPRERTETEAVLVGTVNPKGMETTYQFQWGETPDYSYWEPERPASVGAGIAPQPVTARITGLDAATKYHYRIVAISEAGVAVTPDEVLAPFPE